MFVNVLVHIVDEFYAVYLQLLKMCPKSKKYYGGKKSTGRKTFLVKKIYDSKIVWQKKFLCKQILKKMVRKIEDMDLQDLDFLFVEKNFSAHYMGIKY